MTQLFLSYRRDDSAGFAGRLADDLEAEFGPGSVFRDVDDLRPGEDFVTAITTQLQAVDAVLVMIGPGWLSAGGESARRLDDPHDFVRLEISSALASGKPVIPVLVGGAVMPGAAQLPEAMRDLARRQALVLSDIDWRADLVRLEAGLRGLLGGKLAQPGNVRRQRYLRLSLLGLGVIAAVLATSRFWQTPPPDITGRWHATVPYDWGVKHQETFEFKAEPDGLHGSASYLGVPRTLREGRLDGQQLRFATHSQETLGGDPVREVTHRYRGTVGPDGIRFTLETSGGYSSHAPVEFLAGKVAQ